MPTPRTALRGLSATAVLAVAAVLRAGHRCGRCRGAAVGHRPGWSRTGWRSARRPRPSAPTWPGWSPTRPPEQVLWSQDAERGPDPGVQHQDHHRGQRAGGLRPDVPLHHPGRHRRHPAAGGAGRQRRPVAEVRAPEPDGPHGRGRRPGPGPAHRPGPGRRLAVPGARRWPPAGGRRTSPGTSRTCARWSSTSTGGGTPRWTPARSSRPSCASGASRSAASPAHVAPEGATVLAQSLGAAARAARSPYMLQVSDNDVAEGLHRLVAVQTGFEPSWDGARQAQVAALGRAGHPADQHDVRRQRAVPARPAQPGHAGRRARRDHGRPAPEPGGPAARLVRGGRASAARWPRTTCATSPTRHAARPGWSRPRPARCPG